ncbi:hypothetical protein GWR56_12720 [Mucilaginibacter sp. 14171R-50]|uniref:hypothetical protein n=1 Tax=Mucilaginibacter sp. 14171R-50 TaxID=2703789 RepID=UPI00138C57FB|nr:hypothetical protein [Mucilaginibacter sp. 14171R-50]QHS56358.1 hypothetical protein GWR56_12720 [Mucilaginibacter sp. 14171R-50]
MIVLFDSTCLIECLRINQTESLVKTKVKKFYDIIYNDTIEVLFSDRYIKHLEQVIPDRQIFEALIVELSDKSRLKKENTSSDVTIEQEFSSLYQKCSSPYVFPVSIGDNIVYLQSDENGFSTIKSTSTKYKIIDSLLTKGTYQTSYQDFKNDNEISNFFKDVFSLPRVINKVVIINREIDVNYMISLKGKLIHYYTLKTSGSYFFDDAKEELKKLGGKVKLHYTTNKRDIHERKIIIDGLIITTDNSFQNLTVKEPTWDINIVYNHEKADKWLSKCSKFKPVKQ